MGVVMTQEDKDLLLRDLCARLPYGVKCKVIKRHIDGEMLFIRSGSGALGLTVDNIKELVTNNQYEVKPYLVPLSSMTEEQGKELEEVDPEFYSLICRNGDIHVSMNVRGYDWLNKNHFDYRGFIPKGLAIDATGLNIY